MQKKMLSILTQILNHIEKKDALHYKKVKAFIDTCDDTFIETANNYMSYYIDFLKHSMNVSLEYAVDAYIMMVKDIFVEEVRFKRSQLYRYNNVQTVIEKVYSNEKYMKQYMIGVAFSQFLWRNHRDMFHFFKKCFKDITAGNYLEIGPGHGLFVMEAVKKKIFDNYLVVDISETSLDITKNLMQTMITDNVRIEYKLCDVNDGLLSSTYDFITMGEVLEHVEEPRKLLCSIAGLLKANGKSYISTCANAPVIDHIYLYKSAEQIRNDVRSAGLTIIDEIVIANEDIPNCNVEAEGVNISYACLVEKK